MLMVFATVRMTFSKKNICEAMNFLRSIAERSNVQPGCLSCGIYRNGQDDNILKFEQLWSDQGNLDNYLRSEEYRQLLLVMEIAIEQPEIRFDTIAHSTGIETIEKARKYTEGNLL